MRSTVEIECAWKQKKNLLLGKKGKNIKCWILSIQFHPWSSCIKTIWLSGNSLQCSSNFWILKILRFWILGFSASILTELSSLNLGISLHLAEIIGCKLCCCTTVLRGSVRVTISSKFNLKRRIYEGVILMGKEHRNLGWLNLWWKGFFSISFSERKTIFLFFFKPSTMLTCM